MENCIEILKKTMVPWELSISEMLNVRGGDGDTNTGTPPPPPPDPEYPDPGHGG